MDLLELKAAAVGAQMALDNALDRSTPGLSVLDLFALSGALVDAKKALVHALGSLPDEALALCGATRDGRLVMFNASAKKAGDWQLTRFDAAGVPWGDSQYTNRGEGLGDFLADIEITTLGDFDNLLGLCPEEDQLEQTECPAP